MNAILSNRSCLFATLLALQLCIAASCGRKPDAPSKLCGKYVNTERASWYLELRRDGTFVCEGQFGSNQDFHGRWETSGDEIRLLGAWGDYQTGNIQTGKIVGAGSTWVKRQ